MQQLESAKPQGGAQATIVDLDGTLIRSDMLVETAVWAIFRQTSPAQRPRSWSQ
jgi:beta-phosphoglucomutase-like phosphatase (HAD superfamily)